MVTIHRSDISRFFKTTFENFKTHFSNRKKILIPYVYCFLGIILAIRAHEQSSTSGRDAWLNENPPTLAMWSGELSALGFQKVTDEKTERALYRTFPFKNSKSDFGFLASDPLCIALTSDPEKTALPHFFCRGGEQKKIKKPEWKSIGFGWMALIQAKKSPLPPEKRPIFTPKTDPREIRY